VSIVLQGVRAELTKTRFDAGGGRDHVTVIFVIDPVPLASPLLLQLKGFLNQPQHKKATDNDGRNPPYSHPPPMDLPPQTASTNRGGSTPTGDGRRMNCVVLALFSVP